MWVGGMLLIGLFTVLARDNDPNPEGDLQKEIHMTATKTGDLEKKDAMMPILSISRTPWTNRNGKVVVHSTISRMKAHPDYFAGKTGTDFIAATRLVENLLKTEKIDSISVQSKDKPIFVVPVQAIEKRGYNALPQAMAIVMAHRIPGTYYGEIFQINKVHHTDKTGIGRLEAQAIFQGPVESGADYVIVDDTVTQGGTLANLKSYIEILGGCVIAVHTLSAARFSTKLQPSIDTIEKLKYTYNHELPQVLRYIFGQNIPPETLTEAESRQFIRRPDYFLDRARGL